MRKSALSPRLIESTGQEKSASSLSRCIPIFAFGPYQLTRQQSGIRGCDTSARQTASTLSGTGGHGPPSGWRST